VFNRVIGTEIPEMKGDIRTLDDKISGIETSVEIIKTKVLNGSLRGIKPLQFWSTLGGIILTFGTIILWIMGQLK
ncbi:MAG: hypothetical protein GY804_02490, partial [Alphaproteobacteria bacterium]|nr:hypothetical protein [Alphaproteobacteria bacterium]